MKSPSWMRQLREAQRPEESESKRLRSCPTVSGSSSASAGGDGSASAVPRTGDAPSSSASTGTSGLDPLFRPQTRRMDAATLTSGNLLKVLALDACKEMDAASPESLRMEIVHTYGTLCSGSEVATVALKELEKAMAANGMKHRFKLLWCCEIDQKKWPWEQELVNDHYNCGACIFSDAAELWKQCLPCAVHKKSCPVRPVMGTIAGVSCKDFSKANPKRNIAKGASVLKQTTSAGGSAQTMHGLLWCIESHQPLWVVLENSDELAEEENADWHLVLKFLQSKGYRCSTFIVESTEFAVPARRRRAYLVALAIASRRHSLTNGTFAQFNDRYGRNLNLMRRVPPSILDVLLPPDAAVVKQALEDWSSHSASPLEASTVDGHMSVMRRQCQVVSSYSRIQCRDSSTASPWFSALNNRMKEILSQRQKAHQMNANIQIVDLSQTAHRIPTSAPHPEFNDVIICTAVLPGSFFWVTFPDPRAGTEGAGLHRNIPHERPLVAEEHMMLQGWPIANSPVDISQHPRPVVLSLAGNAFTSSVCLSVFAALIFSVPWNAPDDVLVESAESADAAFDAITLL